MNPVVENIVVPAFVDREECQRIVRIHAEFVLQKFRCVVPAVFVGFCVIECHRYTLDVCFQFIAPVFNVYSNSRHLLVRCDAFTCVCALIFQSLDCF